MKTADFIREHIACHACAKWALSVSSDMADVWDELLNQGKHDWLIWTATRPGVFSESALRKLACRFVRETPLSDGRTVWDLLTDERSRKAVETAEAYFECKVTEEELCAAYFAADAAYYAAADAHLARSAAYAADAAYAAYAAYAACAAAAEAADAAAIAAYFAARAAEVDAESSAAARAAYSKQVKMIAELGNPFNQKE